MQTPLKCVWRRWIRPLFSSGTFKVDHPAVYNAKITKEMKEVLVHFACDNPEEFSDWIHKRATHLSNDEAYYIPIYRPDIEKGTREWALYLKNYSNCTYAPSPFFDFLLLVIPTLAILLISVTGIYSWLS